jgi:hypothetical protein
VRSFEKKRETGERVLTIGAHKELLLLKTILLIICLSLLFVGRSTAFWPIVTWSMYSTDVTEFPPPRTSVIELRVISSTGDLYRLTPSDLFPAGRQEVVADAIWRAYDVSDPQLRDEYQTYLTYLVKQELPYVSIKKIQGWKLLWRVDPLALPPLDRSKPFRESMLGSFKVSPS